MDGEIRYKMWRYGARLSARLRGICTTVNAARKLLKLPADGMIGAEDVLKAFRKAALEHHPDQSQAQDASERFRLIVNARDLLLAHPDLDHMLRAPPPAPSPPADETTQKPSRTRAHAQNAERVRQQARQTPGRGHASRTKANTKQQKEEAARIKREDAEKRKENKRRLNELVRMRRMREAPSPEIQEKADARAGAERTWADERSRTVEELDARLLKLQAERARLLELQAERADTESKADDWPRALAQSLQHAIHHLSCRLDRDKMAQKVAAAELEDVRLRQVRHGQARGLDPWHAMRELVRPAKPASSSGVLTEQQIFDKLNEVPTFGLMSTSKESTGFVALTPKGGGRAIVFFLEPEEAKAVLEMNKNAGDEQETPLRLVCLGLGSALKLCSGR